MIEYSTAILLVRRFFYRILLYLPVTDRMDNAGCSQLSIYGPFWPEKPRKTEYKAKA